MHLLPMRGGGGAVQGQNQSIHSWILWFAKRHRFTGGQTSSFINWGMPHKYPPKEGGGGMWRSQLRLIRPPS